MFFFIGPERSSSQSWVFLDEGRADLALDPRMENTSGHKTPPVCIQIKLDLNASCSLGAGSLNLSLRNLRVRRVADANSGQPTESQ